MDFWVLKSAKAHATTFLLGPWKNVFKCLTASTSKNLSSLKSFIPRWGNLPEGAKKNGAVKRPCANTWDFDDYWLWSGTSSTDTRAACPIAKALGASFV
ncbi:MAG: hypothetical protein EBZ49_04655 [Proteobacteria bacterium]|nr:hypothetical protein [Pseudomonadota bacterium]